MTAARLFKTGGKSLPAVALLLLPKCPACIAAYIALWTGIGISMPAAAHLQWLLISLCAAVLAYLAIAPSRRLLRSSLIFRRSYK